MLLLPPSKSSSRRHRSAPPCLALALLLLMLLGACTSSVPLRAYQRGAGAAAAADGAAPAPPLHEITDTLVRAQQLELAQAATQDLGALVVAAPPPHTIGPGDIVTIVVWDHPELAHAAAPPQGDDGAATPPGLPPPGFVVDHLGQVQFPYAGLVTLAGLTEEQGSALLSSKLARYLNRPIVTLRLQAYRSKRIYIDGEVKSPGLQPINDIPMTLVEALNRAGGALPTADQSRIVLERGPVRYPIDLQRLMQRGVNLNGILLLPGDVLRVPSRDESKVFVSGEVMAPRALTMHNGRLTLNEAMGESGGVSPLGDSRQVYVVRKAHDGPQVYRLDASAPGALALAEEFELRPRDVVFVAASALANWHRSISLMFPGELSSAVNVAKP